MTLLRNGHGNFLLIQRLSFFRVERKWSDNGKAESSSPANVGFFSSHKWKGLSATCGSLRVCPRQCLVSSHRDAGRRGESKIFLENNTGHWGNINSNTYLFPEVCVAQADCEMIARLRGVYPISRHPLLRLLQTWSSVPFPAIPTASWMHHCEARPTPQKAARETCIQLSQKLVHLWNSCIISTWPTPKYFVDICTIVFNCCALFSKDKLP